MKLKTLKDLKKYNVDICKHNPPYEKCCCGDEDTIRIDELKAEAVKWVKAFKKKKVYSYNDIEGGELDIIDFIQDFFNLTEEDLHGNS